MNSMNFRRYSAEGRSKVFWLMYLKRTIPFGSRMKIVGTFWSIFDPLHSAVKMPSDRAIFAPSSIRTGNGRGTRPFS
jgi:hypothetical protein